MTFAEFWPFYVREHAHAGNRRLHFVGTALVIAIFVVMIATQRWMLALLLPLAGYGFAWFGHFVLQRNRPATFKHPFYSLLADFKMFALIATGRMDDEVRKALADADATTRNR